MNEEFFLVNVDDRALFPVKYSDILCVKIDRNYLKVITTYREFKVSGSIERVISLLPNFFKRVHTSYIINVKHLDTIQESFTECKVGNYTIPIGTPFREKIESQIKVFL